MHKKRGPVFSPRLWFVNTSAAVRQLPGLYLLTIKHLHAKVDKGRNSGGGLATKGPIYSVQSGRDAQRGGWEESCINELKMSRNSGSLNTLGFIWRGVQEGGGGGPGGVDSTGFFNFSLTEHTHTHTLSLTHTQDSLSALHMREEQQTVLIWLHNDPVTVSQNRYCQCQCAGRHWLTAG